MPGGLGVLGYIGVAPESSGGVAVNPSFYLQALQEGVSGEFDRYTLFNIAGQLAPVDDRAGLQRIEGDITLPLHPLLGGHLFKSMFGSAANVSTTGIGTGLYRHRWLTPTQSQWDNRFALPPYTFEIFRDVGSAQQYAGMQTNELELTISPNAVLVARLGLIATTWQNKAASTASFRADISPFDFTTASFSIDGTANPNIEAFSVQFGNQLEGIGTLALRDTVYKIRRSAPPVVTFKMTMGFEDIVELSKFRSQSETVIGVNLTSNSFQFNLNLPRCIYTSVPTGMGGGGRQMLEISGMARYQQASITAFDMSLVTNVGSY